MKWTWTGCARKFRQIVVYQDWQETLTGKSKGEFEMASSPLRSPFTSIANCVAKAFNWNASGDSVSPTKNVDMKPDEEPNRSRSGVYH